MSANNFLSFSNITPTAFFSFSFAIIISFTLVFVFISIFFLFNFLKNAFKTSIDESDAGKIRFPLSSFTSTFSLFRNKIISLFVKFLNELYKNLPLPGMLEINSSIGIEDVILHLPFPVISNFLPK